MGAGDELPYDDGHVRFPDARIEYEDGARITFLSQSTFHLEPLTQFRWANRRRNQWIRRHEARRWFEVFAVPLTDRIVDMDLLTG